MSSEHMPLSSCEVIKIGSLMQMRLIGLGMLWLVSQPLPECQARPLMLHNYMNITRRATLTCPMKTKYQGHYCFGGSQVHLPNTVPWIQPSAFRRHRSVQVALVWVCFLGFGYGVPRVV